MIPAFLIISIILLAICIILSCTLFPVLQITRSNKKLAKDGIEAKAVLLSIEKTGLFIKNQLQVKMQVQVQPLTGRNFVTEAREVISALDFNRLHIGSIIRVKYNRFNTKQIMVLRDEYQR